MHLLFDLDGTLSDPGVGITRSIQYALMKLGREPPPGESLVKYIGPPLHEAFVELLGSQQQAASAIVHYRERFASLGLYENRLYEGIEKALGALTARCERMYVVTSKPTIFAQKIVAHFALRGYFHKVYGSNLDGSLADKTALIAVVLRQEKIAAHATLMIGDRRHDVIGARANGVQTIGALWGYGSEQELAESGAQRLCERPGLLDDCVVEHFAG